MDNYFQKYVKYKNKYNQLKGGSYSNRKDFIIIKYENPDYKTYALKNPHPGYTFLNKFFSNISTIADDTKKVIVEYSNEIYILKCYNSDKKINIEVNLDLTSDKFVINIKKVDSLINIKLNGSYTGTKDHLKDLKLIINTSFIIFNGIENPFVIDNKNYTIKELLNGRIVTIDNPNEKKLDELFDFKEFTIHNISNEEPNSYKLYKVARDPNNDILVYDTNLKIFFKYNSSSLICLDNKKFLAIMISYLPDINYTIYLDINSQKIVKLVYKNCAINGSINYENRKFQINELDNLNVNNIEFTFSDFRPCELTDFFKNKYSIKEITSCDPYLHNILTFLNKDDPKLNNLKDVTPNQINSTIYDYESEYDKFREDNLNSICMGQSVLFKSIYNSLFNLFYIENKDEINKIRNISVFIATYLIRKKLLIKFQSINDKLFDICKNNDDRSFLLQNITKKIITTNKDFQIFSKTTENFIDFPDNMKLIFDTGNEANTIIGREIVEILGLEEKDIFITQGHGVGIGASEYDGKYVTVKLKFKSISPFNIKNNEYEFNAIVTSNSMTNTLLLGQSSKGLKQFFEDNYCIVYNNSKTYYNDRYQRFINYIDKEIEIVRNASSKKEIKNCIKGLKQKFINIYTTEFLDDEKIIILFNEFKNVKFKTFIDEYMDLIKRNEPKFKEKIQFIIDNNILFRSILDVKDWNKIVAEFDNIIPKLNDQSDADLIENIKKLK